VGAADRAHSFGTGLDSEELHDLGFDARLEEIEERQDNSGPGCSLPS
jgi:hypothetical protein